MTPPPRPPPASRPAPPSGIAAGSRSRLPQLRLAGYLAATAGSCGLATTADAAVISIDITNPSISGPNAGLADGTQQIVYNWPTGNYGSLFLQRNAGGFFGGWWGITPADSSYMNFAVNGYDATPTNVAPDTLIGSSARWSGAGAFSVFNVYNRDISPDFGPDSFMGFRFKQDTGSDWYYGYIEVTWTSATNTFEILSAAYESTPNASILTPAPVPEPGAATMAFGALASLCLGGRALGRWKQQRRSEPQGDAGEPAHDLPQTAA